LLSITYDLLLKLAGFWHEYCIISSNGFEVY
jgi:hypothetical protein